MDIQQEKHIKDLIKDLDIRTKELNLLYKVDEVLNNPDLSIEKILKQLILILPTGFRYPEVCKIKITIHDLEVADSELKITDLKLSCNIVVEDQMIGDISIFYIKPIRSEKGIFLDNEKKLMSTIADKLSKYIYLRKLKSSIDEIGHSTTPTPSFDNIDEKTKLWLKGLHLSEEEIEKMTRVKIRFRKNEIICKQGAITSYIMILAEGLSKNYLEGNLDRGFNFKIIKPFDFIGLSSLFGSDVYHFSGNALTPSTIYHIDANLFKEIIFSNKLFAEKIFHWYCKITKWHLNRLSAIANKQSHGRISDVLLYLYEDVFDKGLIDSVISRKDIAELAGMTTESAVRILSELKKDNIIKIHNKGIEISDIRFLKTLSIAG